MFLLNFPFNAEFFLAFATDSICAFNSGKGPEKAFSLWVWFLNPQLVKEAVQRGQNREEEILREAAAEANAIREKAAADIAMEKRKAINDATNEISGMAVAIAEKIVEREISAADQDKLVEDFIRNLGDQV